MMAQSWKTLLLQSIAKHQDDPTAKYCQLATAAIGGGASCRTWVFRGFWDNTNALKFITDRRSDKVAEIAADPVGEVVFYLRKTREQFRIKGRLIVVSASESDEQLIKARNQQWKQISPASKASFATSHIPGLELSAQENSDATSTTDEQKGRGEEIEVVDIPDTVENFSLVLLWPYNVDHLVLKDGQHRYVHSLVKEHDEIFPVWKTVAVNP